MVNGKNIIGYGESSEGPAFECRTAAGIETRFHKASPSEIDQAMALASKAFVRYRNEGGARKAAFLRNIAEGLESLGDELVHTAMTESGLPEGRIKGEIGRTCGQLRLFANLVEEGSWVEAVIDRGDPDRQPLPKPDIRRMLVPIGPVVVFTASNFPLAFSTAGGDTASALAAGCPVIVKGHEAHPATNEVVARAVAAAARRSGMPEGVFSSLNGDHETGRALVLHPDVAAVAFTGSYQGGKALFDLAGRRPKPIAVFAEMGSINPVVLLPQYLRQNSEAVAQQLAASISMGAGQFCTNPGLILLPKANENDFVHHLQAALQAVPPQCMLNEKIYKGFKARLESTFRSGELEWILAPSENSTASAVLPVVARASAAAFLRNPLFHAEVFGPYSLLVTWQTERELQQLIASLEGQLTVSVFTEGKELEAHSALLDALREIAGRLILNNVPTGVEVCAAMQHGGPWPATTDSRFTSVGTGAIRRFARPLAYQGWPDALLPPALQNGNPLGIRRGEGM